MSKRSLVVFFLGAIIAIQLSAADSLTNRTANSEMPTQERFTMTKMSFGNHSAIRVPRNLQEKIRAFYHDVLGCEITKQTEDMDYFRMGDSFFVAFLYDDDALAEPEWLKSIWLEIKADDVPTMKQKILAFGVKEVNSRDKSHLYFQAPGGQVFRLVRTNEDLSRFER